MDVPTARLGMRTDGGRISSSLRSWRLCLRCMAAAAGTCGCSSRFPAPAAISPGIAWGQS